MTSSAAFYFMIHTRKYIYHASILFIDRSTFVYILHLCFDYKELYSTGNCYLSAILTTERGEEIIGYDRLVDASYRGVGTVAMAMRKRWGAP